MGMIPLGAGFWVDREQAEALRLANDPGLAPHVRRYLNGRDLMQLPRNILALGFFGLSEQQVRTRFPAAYQWILERVKPQRIQDKRESRRRNWWIFAESVPKFRKPAAGLARYIGTAETSKHRTFVFVAGDVLPDQKVRVVTLGDAFHLGVLSSRLHVRWTLATGGTLEDRPVYNNTLCFEPFPFPHHSAESHAIVVSIRSTAEELDGQRKRQQAAHATLTLTDMYNVLDALRLGRPLSAKEKLTHANGLISVLAELHDRLDALVLQAYGWADLAPALVGQPGGTSPWPEKPAAQAAAEEELLVRLVALNAERAAEEARGTVRWLRPEFQDPARRGAAAAAVATQDALDLGTVDAPALPAKMAGKSAVTPSKLLWPNTLPEQMRSVADVLTSNARPIGIEVFEIAFTSRGPWKRRIPQILDALAALGRARKVNGLWTSA